MTDYTPKDIKKHPESIAAGFLCAKALTEWII